MSAQLSPETLAILTSPPFVDVEGVINIRDAGGQISSRYPDKQVKSRYIFRAGEPSRITEKGKIQLRDLGIKHVFDMRAEAEMIKYGTTAFQLEGISFTSAPIATAEAYDPVSLAFRMKAFETDYLQSFIKLYMGIVDNGGSTAEKILTYLRDHPEAPCLVHCTAGKDRTGVFVALILLVLGVSDEEIVDDYALTTVGLEPVLPLLIARFNAQKASDDNQTGTRNMARSSPETMVAFLKEFRNKYGTAEDYIKTKTPLTDQDIAQIRDNLLVPKA